MIVRETSDGRVHTIEISGSERLTLKECANARWHASGEGRNRASGNPEVADVWLNAALDFLQVMGYSVTKERVDDEGK